ncbi:MAG: threonine synthase [Chloroflexota bacterium]|jgi:threonine synthase|nr:MAG: threonine synthase [SAR202 cluster bacterium]MAR86182.1 threonine synthase [Chloroflexota bacterium]MEE3344994.1 threonine synthase [Chloroflexota bacterium]
MRSYLTNLECTYCGETFSADEPMRLCDKCGKVLYPRYDISTASKNFTKDLLRDRAPNMWRYFEMMPIREESNIVTLGEGFTPIFETKALGAKIGSNALFLKDEGLNPTASFKARGLSAAVSKAKELGLKKLTMPSAGNAAGAMASYAARAGLEAFVFMPQDAPEANQKEVIVSGGNLNLIDGLISDAGIISRGKAAEMDLFDVSTLQEPYRVEGKKTMGYEIAEQSDWQLPDNIIYPTGGGTGIVGMWKAFQEMEDLGWISSKRPKMFAIQAENCAPIVRAFENGTEFAEPWENASTMAAGMRVPSAIGDYLILNAIRESGGCALTVSDAEMADMTNIIGSLEGFFVCPEGAATACGAQKLIQYGLIDTEETTLLLNTGSGLKYLDMLP